MSEENDERILTLAEVAEAIGRSITWVQQEERKQALIEAGATLGGRGVGSKVPWSAVEKLGWDKLPSTAGRGRTKVGTSRSREFDGENHDEAIKNLTRDLGKIEADMAALEEKLEEKREQAKHFRREIKRIERDRERHAEHEKEELLRRFEETKAQLERLGVKPELND